MICDSLIVYRHEVSRLLRSLRFRVSFVLIVLLFAGGSRLFVSLYMEQQATYKQLVEDEELRDAMKENGIGRPSTRASRIIYEYSVTLPVRTVSCMAVKRRKW